MEISKERMRQRRVSLGVGVVVIIISSLLCLRYNTSWVPYENDEYTLPQEEVVTDELYSDGIVLGNINPSVQRNYAVFSSTIDYEPASLNFLFLLPLTALAWKRVGFDSIVVLVGSADLWFEDAIVKEIVSRLKELESVIVFLEPRPENSVLLSQVSRMFVANILRAHASNPDALDDTYIITSDADIWPLDGAAYRLPVGKDILLLNAECCGSFSHNDSKYTMFPMSNIGMTVGKWRQVTQRFGHLPKSVEDIMTFVHHLFGPIVRHQVVKGENLGWYIDQRTVSILIGDWIQASAVGENSSIVRLNRVAFIRRNTKKDRIDRIRWSPSDAKLMEGKIDAHLLENGYRHGVWSQLVPLIERLHGGPETEWLLWSKRYHENFLTVCRKTGNLKLQ